MPSSTSSRSHPGDDPGIEARLRAELGQGELSPEVRQQHLSRLQELAAELGPPAADGDGGTGAGGAGGASVTSLRPFEVDGQGPPANGNGHPGGGGELVGGELVVGDAAAADAHLLHGALDRIQRVAG